jgi:hypothetical protein
MKKTHLQETSSYSSVDKVKGFELDVQDSTSDRESGICIFHQVKLILGTEFISSLYQEQFFS